MLAECISHAQSPVAFFANMAPYTIVFPAGKYQHETEGMSTYEGFTFMLPHLQQVILMAVATSFYFVFLHIHAMIKVGGLYYISIRVLGLLDIISRH